ncbi:hypothetical protein KR093_005393, partial [Drosophila rubida]
QEEKEQKAKEQLEEEHALRNDEAKPSKEDEEKHELNFSDVELELPQRPRSLGSNAIQESADYVLQLLHAYAAAFGL